MSTSMWFVRSNQIGSSIVKATTILCLFSIARVYGIVYLATIILDHLNIVAIREDWIDARRCLITGGVCLLNLFVDNSLDQRVHVWGHIVRIRIVQTIVLIIFRARRYIIFIHWLRYHGVVVPQLMVSITSKWCSCRTIVYQIGAFLDILALDKLIGSVVVVQSLQKFIRCSWDLGNFPADLSVLCILVINIHCIEIRLILPLLIQ